MHSLALPRSWRALISLVAAAFFTHAQGADPGSPNVVLILADDLGAHDPGVSGSRFHETPNLDRLAREGLQFSQAYSACTVCSPTRAALMTGKHPARLRITDWIAGHDFPKGRLRPPADWVKQLPLSETTIAEIAKSRGYATLHLGKWHLGGDGFGPETQGFDANLGGDHRGQPPSYFSPYGLPRLPDGPKGEYLTDREGTEAAAFIRANRSRRFFLNYWPYSVHTPLQAPQALIEKYQAKAARLGGTPGNPVYAAMLESLDLAVGKILSALDETGVASNTVVIFTSDNGGLVLGKAPPTSNAPLRSGKGSPYEGGIRIPLLVRWPGVTPPGGSSAQPVVTMDIAATVSEIIRGAASTNAPDGISLVPVLRNAAATFNRDALFWHYPHYHPGGATPYAAIRSGEWKLIQYYEDGRHELFHLAADPGEQKDLAAADPDRVTQLARKLFDWQGKAGAQWPMYNPGHSPEVVAGTVGQPLVLPGHRAAIHGSNLRYEPMPFKNTLGWWSRPEDWVDWKFSFSEPGEWEVEILQGCGRGHGGSDVNLEIDQRVVPFVVEETGHFQNFVPRRLARIQMTPGVHTLALKPQRKQGGAVMDVRQVRLVPASQPSEIPVTTMNLLSARRVVLLGDSITYAGEWGELVETWIRCRFPKSETQILNLGLPSETTSGLSEPGHAGGAFPRPDLHERLERVLARAKPDLVIAGYGMNDGIYHPLSEDRFAKFRDGIRRLRETCAHEGVRVIHLTPPLFDPLPLAGGTLPEGRDSYPSPFEGYDRVLARYSNWLVSQRTNGWEVVDIHSPMEKFVMEKRVSQPRFVLAGDGVHANSQGHWLIARELLKHFGADPAVFGSDNSERLLALHPRGREILAAVQKRQRVMKDAWLNHVGHLRPGMAKGKPLAEAEEESARWGEELRRWVSP